MIRAPSATRRALLSVVAWTYTTLHPGAAGAGDGAKTALDVTSTTISAWHTSDDHYGELFERLNLAASHGDFQFGARGDSATFAQPPSAAVRDRYTLEKVWVSHSGRSLELTAGDAYISFGRGLALSLRKVDELGLDTTLRGAKLLVHGESVGATIAAGYTNVNNVDEASGKSIEDPRDLVAGARIEATERGLTVGAHATAVVFHDSLSLVSNGNYRDRFYQFGPTLDAPRLTDWLALYVESIAQVRSSAAANAGSLASGLYAVATVYAEPLTLLFEGKAYGALEPIKPRLARPEFAAVAYNSPPTAERLLQILENPQKRIGGGRLRADWKVTRSLTSYANYGLFLDELGYADPVEPGRTRAGLIHDPYLGLEARSGNGSSWLLASFGWRGVFLEESRTMVRRDVHFEGDGVHTLGGKWSATLHALHAERRKYESSLLDHRFREGSLLLGVRRQPWAIALGYDYTTDPIQPKRDYFNANVEWNISGASSVRVFAGGTRGGLRCISGVCRLFPPFEGVRVSTILRF